MRDYWQPKIDKEETHLGNWNFEFSWRGGVSGNHKWKGEDIVFGEKAAKAGVEQYADSSILAIHQGRIGKEIDSSSGGILAGPIE